MENTCEPIVPRKRSYEDSNDRDHESLRKPKVIVQAVQNFPPADCGIKESDTKPLKNSTNVHPNVENKKLMISSLKPNKLSRSTCFTSTRPPSGKVKFWDPISSTSGVAHKPKVTTTVIVRKPLKPLNGGDTHNVKMNSRVNVNVNESSLKSQSFEHVKLRNISSSSSKPAGKVKFWDPITAGCDQQPKITTTVHVSKGKTLKNSENIDPNGGQAKRFQPEELRRNKSSAQKSEVTMTSVSQKENAKREKIKEAMNVFDQIYPQLLQENRMKTKGEKIAHWRVPLEAVKLTKQMLKWMEPVKSLGTICGVQIGDKFKYRAQLKMIGLHCQLQSGIDYTNIEGKNLAISIVDSHRYANETGSTDTLIYCGHGGLQFLGPKSPPEDQELKLGNLALKNSMDERSVIRVIKKLEFDKNEVFVYDGLYVANHYTQKRNEDGKMMFKYHLHRVPGQPALHQMLNASC